MLWILLMLLLLLLVVKWGRNIFILSILILGNGIPIFWLLVLLVLSLFRTHFKNNFFAVCNFIVRQIISVKIFAVNRNTFHINIFCTLVFCNNFHRISIV